MQKMYEGKAFSPPTSLTRDIGAADTIVYVEDESVFPAPPGYATIGTDESGETIEYAAVAPGVLSGCVRGVEGTPQNWLTGESISRCWNNADYEALRGNVTELEEKKLDRTGEGQEVTVSFDEAETREPIRSGESLGTLFGKMKQWLGALGSAAWKDTGTSPGTVAEGDHAHQSYDNHLADGDIHVSIDEKESWNKTIMEALRCPRASPPSTLKTRTTDIATVTIKGHTPEGSIEGVETGGSITFVATNGIDTNTATLPLTEPLRRLGEVCDEYDGKTGKLTRRIGLSGEALTVLPQPIISYHRADLACYDGDTTVTCSDPLVTDMEVTVYDSRPAGDARTLGGQLPIVYEQSRENLLINWHLAKPVNQRGGTEYTRGYAIDMWYLSAGNVSLIVQDGYIRLQKTANTGYPMMIQTLESDLADYLIGKQVTLSVQSTEGVTFTTIKVPSGAFDAQTFPVGTNFCANLFRNASGAMSFRILTIASAATGSYVDLEAAKLELGPVSTLHLDPPPNYGQELAKCQRYCITASYVGLRASVVSPSVFYFNVPTPVTMHSTPAIVQNKMSVNALDGTAQTGFSFSIVGKSAGAIIVRAEKTDHGLKDAYLYCGHIGGQPTIFSADL